MLADGFNYGQLAAIGVIALLVLWVVKKFFSSDD